MAGAKDTGGVRRAYASIAMLIAFVACLATPSAAGAATASWAFEPASFDFGVVMPGEAAPEPAHLKLVNTGETWLAPRFPALASEGAFGLVSNGCQSSLAPGGSCIVEVTFEPRSSGPKEATLEMFAANGTAPPAVARLTGAGVAPTVTIDPTSIDFGTMQAGIRPPQQRTITVTNQGPGELSIASIEFLTAEAWTIPGPIRWIWTSSRSCSSHYSLAPAGSCTVTFEFGSSDPVSAAGELRITDNALDSPQIIHVSGSVSPEVRPQPGPTPEEPQAVLGHRPRERTRSRTAGFTFSGNPTTAGFVCRLDRGPFRPCISPTRYRSLKPGHHRFTVRATGSDGTQTQGANYGWQIVTKRLHKKHTRSR